MHLWFIHVWECRYWQDGDFHARFCLLFVSIFPVLVPMNFSGLFWQSLKQNAKEEFATCILFIFFLERLLRKVHYIDKNMWTANTTPVCACWIFNYKTIGINGETVQRFDSKLMTLSQRSSIGFRFEILCKPVSFLHTRVLKTTFLWPLLWCTSFYFICLCKEISVCNIYLSY